MGVETEEKEEIVLDGKDMRLRFLVLGFLAYEYLIFFEIVLDGSGDKGEGRDCLRWEGYAARVFSFGFPCV